MNWSRVAAFTILLPSGAYAAESPGRIPVALAPGRMVAPLKERLRTAWNVVSFDNASASDYEEAVAVIPEVVTLGTNSSKLADLVDRVPHGRLFQLPMTGYDILNMTAIPPRFAVCNVHNARVAIPEYVLSAILSWNVRLPELDAHFRRCAFGSGAEGQMCARPPVHREAKGQTIGIVGYGSLGSGVAIRAVAFGMRVVAVTGRPPEKVPPPLAWLGNDTMLPRLMHESDFVVVSCPLVSSTRGLVNAEVIKYMKPTAVIINVARGPIIDEAALFHALEGRRIGGAVLDVWWKENWLSMTGSWSRFNFSALPNVWMTPHISYETAEAAEGTVEETSMNLDAFARGEPLQNVVRNATSRATHSDVLTV